MRDRLIEIIKNSLFNHIGKSCNLAENIADDLLNENVIVLPCKVGDTVYQLDTAGNIYESEITKIIFDTKVIAFDERAINKTIFLAYQKAEQALKERLNNG